LILVKFTEDVRETIYKLVRKGYPYKDICAVCDIDESTFYKWIDRGKKAKSGKYKEFVVELDKAKAERKNNLVSELLEMGRSREDWKALAWLLERGYGDELARPEVKIKADVGAKAEVEHKGPLAKLAEVVLESGKKLEEEKKE
jgi:DNA invertase Pin-like site-specific DNA recombinase